jgi:hypothetical protein
VDPYKTLRALATSCHYVHQRVGAKPELDAKYFRFDVDRGLADITLEKWDELERRWQIYRDVDESSGRFWDC